MTKPWNIDKAIAKLEPTSAPGTSITRVYMDVAVMEKYGVKPTEEQIARGSGNVWCVALGYSYAAKAMFYGQTIRGAYLRAKKAVEAGKPDELAKRTPWGVQDYKPNDLQKKVE